MSNGLIIIILLAFCPFAWSADIPSAAAPGAVEKSLSQPAIKMPTKLPEIVVQEKEGQTLRDVGVKFQLKSVTFEGNRVVLTDKLKSLVQKYIGQTIEVRTLTEIANMITAYYESKGYFLSKAYVPPQTIKDGEVLIKIREGRLGDIIIKGNNRYNEEGIRNTLKVVRGEGAIRTNDVERALLLLTDYPGLNVKATFAPGDLPGTSDMVIDVKEDRFFNVGVDYDNFGSKFISQNRYGASLNFNNTIAFGDLFSFRGITGDYGPDKLLYGRAEYVIPLGYSGTRMGINYHYMNYKLVKDLEILNAGGESRGVGIWLSHPFYRSRNFNWFGEVGFDAKDVEQTLLSQTVGKDKVRYARIGTTLQWIDALKGSNTIGIRGYQGLASVLDGMNQSYTDTIRIKTDVVYTKVEVDFARIQSLPVDLSLLINAFGQFSGNRLPSSEMLSIGGAGTVRGFAESEFSGDSGYYATAELRIPIYGLRNFRWFGSGKTVGETLQLAAFYDCGEVKITDALASEASRNSIDIQGAGVGLRFTYSPYLRFKVDWAKAIGTQKPLDQNDKDSGVWYIQAALSY